MTYPLAPNGIFWTIQGEGALIGEPMVFVRLAGCSIGCVGCDTDYRVNRRASIEDIYRDIRAALPTDTPVHPWVWITGGEPTDHDLEPLIGCLKSVGFRVALATAGVRLAPKDVDWLSVSPHSSKLVQQTGHELKAVPHLNGMSLTDIERLPSASFFPNRYIQPIDWHTANGPEHDGAQNKIALQECLDFIRTHPGWRLGLQAHKVWGLP